MRSWQTRSARVSFGKAPGFLGRGTSSTPTAADVLHSIIDGSTGGAPSPYGSIQFSDPTEGGGVINGLLQNSAAVTAPNNPIRHSVLGFSTSSTIYINTLPVPDSFNSSVANAETTILHELGHVLSNLNWKGDQILSDGTLGGRGPDQSLANSELIQSKCGIKQ